MLKALSPLDGRYRNKIAPLGEQFSEYGLIKYRFRVEIEWLLLLAKTTNIPNIHFSQADQSYLKQCIEQFNEKDAEAIKNIERTTNHDVKAVELYIAKLFNKKKSLKPFISFIHFGCTSEDINNLAYALMLKDGRDLVVTELKTLLRTLKQMAKHYAKLPMLARTHGQPATPTTLGKEFKNVAYRLETQINNFNDIKILGKFNGATGNYNAHSVAYPKINWPALSKKFISQLKLTYNPYTTQIEPHDYIAELMHALIRINNILIDLDRDLWAYISLNYFTQKMVNNEVGSSTMPHKVNPIDFENSEGNAGISNALADHLANKLPVSRWQRDLTDSTVLRNLGVIFGHSLLAYQATQKGLSKLEVNPKVIQADLNQHWEVLTEAVQTVMRAHGIADSYQQLKKFSRGRTLDQAQLHAFIQQTSLPEKVKAQLLSLSPEKYTGIAAQLASERS